MRATGRAGLGAAIVALAAYLGGLAHLVVVRHATCPRHGEVVHAGPGGMPEARVVELDVAAGQAAAAAESPDDHCPVVASSRRYAAGLRPAGVVALAPLLAGDLAPPVTPSLTPASERLLLLAPKTSPPAAAIARA